MAQLELLVSPPGTGKTTYCIDLFRDSVSRSGSGIDSRSYFILPSREHAERIQNLVLKKDVAGLFNAHILNIQDLAEKLLRVSDDRRPTEMVRRSLVTEILSSPAEAEAYGFFRESLGLRGFQELALEAIREFKVALLSAKDLDCRAQPLVKDPVFRSKFKDFSIILKRYDERLAALGFAEAEDRLRDIEKLEISERPDLVIFDGFYHFTRFQEKLLSLVGAWADRTIVTLTMDKAHPAGEAIFGYPERTRRRLAALGFREKNDFVENHRTTSPALRHLTSHVFSANPPRYEKEAPVAVFSAPFPRTEYEMIAREIRKLYREEAVHFSDICLVLRSVSGQRALIESVFGEYDVPIAIHERSRYAESGLVSAFHRLLRLGVEDWRREDVLSLAKSSYLRDRLPLAEALELEAAALREGIVAGRQKWEHLSESAEMSKPARSFLVWLLQTEKKLLTASGVRVFSNLAAAFMRSLPGSDNETDETALRSIASVLSASRARDAGDGEAFDAPQYMREVLRGVENGLFSRKVHGRNRVQVYDVVMALPKEYKIVFICDLVEKTFPQPLVEDPLFKDAERRILNGDDPVLEERVWRLGGERYFFYMAAARAKERLYLTHATHDAAGSPVLESFFIGEAMACFGKKAVRTVRLGVSDFLPAPEEWASEADVSRGLAGILFRGGAARAVSETVPAGWKAAAVLSRAAEYATGKGRGLNDPAARKLMASADTPFSPTGLETFFNCPFRYFAESVLRLNGPLEGREYARMGTLLHETLQEYFEHLTEAERAGGYLKDPARMEKELEKIFVRRFEEGAFRGEPLYRQNAWRESMRRMLQKYVKLEAEADTGFVPAHFEYSFGKGRNDFLRLPDKSGQILIKGSVDRVDVDASGKKAVVIDYKRSSRHLKKKLKDGEEIQLPLYLLAVRQLLRLEPAGLEHRVLKNGERQYPEWSAEDLASFLSQTEERVRQAVRRIRSSETQVRPKDCAFCEFEAVCRIEAKKGHEF